MITVVKYGTCSSPHRLPVVNMGHAASPHKLPVVKYRAWEEFGRSLESFGAAWDIKNQ